MSRAIALVAVLVLVGLFSRDARAAETSFAEIGRIIDAGRLVVALPKLQRPPYVIDIDGQEVQGIDPWLARLIAEALEVELQLDRSVTSSNQLIELVAAGKADLALGGILITARRALRVGFSRPYVREAPSLLLHRRDAMPFHSTCPTLSEVTGLLAQPNQVALQRGGQTEAIARRLVPDALPRLFDDPLEQFAAVLAGDVTLSIHSEAQSRYLLHQRPSARIQIRSCLGGARSHLVAIAVRPDSPDLLRWVNTFLEAELIDLTAEELLQFGERENLWP